MAITRTVFITGGARRIGMAVAKYLHSSGYNIIITYNKSSREANILSKILNDIRQDSFAAINANFSSKKTCEAAYKKAIKVFGRIDVLINNASKFYPTKINDVDEKSWSDIIDTNLKIPLLLSREFYPELKKRKGSIINIIDIHIDPPLKDHIIYNVSKAGLLALTKSLAKDLAPHIRVNGVSPGAIMWPETDMGNSSKKKEILSRIALRRTGEPDDIAKAILFLIQSANYVTGQNIDIDGGRKLNM
jgi:pteridine reductase